MIWSRSAIAGLIASVSVFSLALGLTYPLLALKLEAAGTSSALIGINASMTPLGLVLSAPMVPRVARRLSPLRLLTSAIVAVAVVLCFLAAINNAYVWMPLRFLLGCAVNALFVVGESSAMKVAEPRERGRVMGAYNASVNFGYALGPLFVSFVGSTGPMPFLITIGVTMTALVPLALLRERAKELDLLFNERARITSFMSQAPLLLLGAASTALFDNASMSLLPVFGLRHGLTERASTAWLAAVLVGGVVLQYPIGWITDRFPHRRVLALCAVLALGGCIALSAAFHLAPLRWIGGFLWGGAAMGVYTVTLAELSHRFRGSMLVAGNAALGMTWGVSSMLGVPAAGMAMDYFGTTGLMWVLGTPFTIVAVLALPSFRKNRPEAANVDEG